MSLAPSLASSLRIAPGYPVSACTQASATSITSSAYGASPTQKLFALVGGFTCTFDGSSLTNSFTGGDVVWTLITSGTTSSESWGIYQGRVVGLPVGTTTCSGGGLATSVYLCILGYENCAGYGWFGNGSGTGITPTFTVTPQAAGSMLLAMVNDGHGSSARTSTSTQIVDTKTNPGDNDSYWIEAPKEWFKAPGSYTYGAASPAPSSAYAFVAIEIQASSTADPAEFPYFILPPQGAATVLQDFEQHTMGRGPLPWNPERSASAWGITPAIATKPPLSGPYKATVLPDFFMRPVWNPERTWIARAGWTQALWAIPPTWKMEPSLPTSFARPAWNPEKTETDRAGWTQSLWALPPTKIPEPILPERRLTPWNPERSATERPASVQATWAVPPTKIPEPELADSWMRPAWNPERSHSVGIPYLPPTWPTTVLLPQRNARPPWDPEKGWQSRAGWIQALWAIAPQKLPEPELPERFIAPWRPPDQQPVWPPFQFAAVLVPTWGYETYGPQTFLRPLWNPDRTSFSRAGFTQPLWAVPPTQIPDPVAPAWFSRPMWSPERSHNSSTPLIIPRGPVPTTLPERYPPIWSPERTGVIIAQRIIVAPAPLLSWEPHMLERFVQALRAPPNLDLFAPALPPLQAALALGPMLFGRRDTTGLSGRADQDALSGVRDPAAISGKQDTAQLTGTRGSDDVKGKVS